MYKDLFSARRGKEQEGRAVSVINSAHRDFLMYLLWPSIYQTLINYSQTTPGICPKCIDTFIFLERDISTGCLRKNALLGFLYPWEPLMPVVTIVLVKVVGGMLDDD